MKIQIQMHKIQIQELKTVMDHVTGSRPVLWPCPSKLAAAVACTDDDDCNDDHDDDHDVDHDVDIDVDHDYNVDNDGDDDDDGYDILDDNEQWGGAILWWQIDNNDT